MTFVVVWFIIKSDPKERPKEVTTMDSRKIKSKMVLYGINSGMMVSELNAQGVTISRNTWFKKLRGETEFTRKEIEGVAKVLNLTDEEIIDFFF